VSVSLNANELLLPPQGGGATTARVVLPPTHTHEHFKNFYVQTVKDGDLRRSDTM